MAQHYPIECFSQKRMRDIEKGIRSNFAKAYGMKTSMKYIYSEDLTKAYDVENREVYLATYSIPKSIYGDTKGVFEIHWNNKTRIVEHIYLPI